MRVIRKLIIVLLAALIAAAILIIALGSVVVHEGNKTKAAELTSTDDTLSKSELRKLKKMDAECILVLGAGISDTDTPSPILKERLDAAVKLYRAGVAPKVLLSGDNGTVNHNEAHVMLQYMKKAGIPDEDIFCDHAGFSTYESIYRAQSVFCVERMVVVTQSYHLSRALYLADKLGIDALGVASDQHTYSGQAWREAREELARVKDFFKAIFQPDPTYGGDRIPINGSGVESHGE